ncbi:MAG: hypothetical protein AB7G06_05270 [Bdellovibrionales bacterium]
MVEIDLRHFGKPYQKARVHFGDAFQFTALLAKDAGCNQIRRMRVGRHPVLEMDTLEFLSTEIAVETSEIIALQNLVTQVRPVLQRHAFFRCMRNGGPF